MKIVSSKPTITRKELESVLECLINDELTSGNTVKAFESAIGEITGIKYSLAVNSPVSAYYLIFRALSIGKEDEVIIPTLFDQAPLSALGLVRGTAVLVDSDENSLAPSIDMIKEKITERTKAIVVGHHFGFHF